MKAYHYHGGSVVGGKQLTVWDGSKNNSSYNAYIATFENQSAATSGFGFWRTVAPSISEKPKSKHFS